MASIGLAQVYTVCCGDRLPANLQQQQQRAWQREGRIAADSAMSMWAQ